MISKTSAYPVLRHVEGGGGGTLRLRKLVRVADSILPWSKVLFKQIKSLPAADSSRAVVR